MRIKYGYFIVGGIVTGTVLIFLLNYLSPCILKQSFSDANTFWSMITNIFTIGAFTTAIIAVIYAYKTWGLEKLPVVHAIGTFIISTKTKTNQLRDQAIFEKNSIHTLQVVNVGRGPAKKIVPSVRKNISGRLLEAVNPHSFSLPANKGTKEFEEILQVHGQRFVRGDEYELELEEDRKKAFFYIQFEDYKGHPFTTKVIIEKVEQADGKLDKLIKTNGIEIWKVMDNTVEKT